MVRKTEARADPMTEPVEGVAKITEERQEKSTGKLDSGISVRTATRSAVKTSGRGGCE
jgi:hypothetical protein